MRYLLSMMTLRISILVIAVSLMAASCGGDVQPGAVPTSSPDCPSPSPRSTGASPSPVPPECLALAAGAELWEGTHVIDNVGVCKVVWDVTFTVLDDELSGSLEVVRDSCGGGESGQVTGTRTGDIFHLDAPYADRDLPIEGDTVSHTLHPAAGSNETWDLRCTNC